MIRALALLAAFALSACAGPDLSRFGKACTVIKRAELPLTIERNFLLAPVWIDDTGAFLIVDTGAEATLLTPESAARLSLTPDRTRSTTLLGVSGPVTSQNVTVREMRVGAVTRTGLSVTVGALTAFPETGLPVAGLLGDDLLHGFDVEIDAPRRRLALYEVNNCQGFRPDGFSGWSTDLATVPAARTQSGLVFPEVLLEGRPVRALLDSGARTSLVTRRAAAAIGVDDQAMAGDPSSNGQGVGLGDISFRLHRFGAVAVGGLKPEPMALNVAALRLPVIDMLLGADWLARNRVWVPRRGPAIFVQAK